MELAAVRTGLARFVAAEFGAGARLADVTESDGHAGLTYLFEVEDGARRHGYVVKLAPPGVKRRGNTDVYRQAPLLRALRAAGQPVPEVPWACAEEDNDCFPVPWIVMERLPGRGFFVWQPAEVFDRGRAACESLWTQCAEALPRLHAFDWRTALADWEQPEDLRDQVTRWERIYVQAPEPAWAQAAEDCERALLETLPDGAPVGLFHGDYQPGNVLFHEGRLTGIIDWEISGLGAQLLDVGWLMMTADTANWVPGWRPIHPIPPARVQALYEAGRGARFPEIPWYQALAGYRLGSIACLNVKLHRKGQRHDPVWENIAHCVTPMFERARAILAGL